MKKTNFKVKKRCFHITIPQLKWDGPSPPKQFGAIILFTPISLFCSILLTIRSA